ncbi:MAG: M20 family metallopeptidase [Cytophagales bacterium]|nr:M20 family metallopeptidase [Cytophagales bacterium]
MVDRIKVLAKACKEEVIAVRRHLHQHPELSFKENETAVFIEKKLKEYGLKPERKADTGVVALIKGRNPEKKVVALRADMDALPITEENDAVYRSQNEGIMHACGHDAHTASLLGAAKILSELADEFEGTVKLLFQPGEESLPGGASLMIRDGALKKPAPEAVIGQHVMPLIESGKVGFREGMYMASCDELYLTVQGKGGHGAMPEMNVDPVLIAAHIIVALQQLVSRNAGPKRPTVLSFGGLRADGHTNVIPDKVEIVGTFRAMDEEWRAEAHRRLRKMAESIAEGMGGSCDVRIKKGYPYLENEPVLTGRKRRDAEAYLGKENVVDLDIWMGAEDFAYYSQEMPACFYRLGSRNEKKGIVSGVHTPTFDIDEDALEIGAGLMAWMAFSELKN